MPARLNVELRGLREEQRRAEETVRQLKGPALLGAIRQGTLMVQAAAKKKAKVDTGRWRASITPAVSVMGNVVRGVVGSNLSYGPFADLDTRPHWPPLAPILEWVRRKRMVTAGRGPVYSLTTRRRQSAASARLEAEYAIAKGIQRKIAQRGTKGDHALEEALDENASRIIALIERAADRAIGG